MSLICQSNFLFLYASLSFLTSSKSRRLSWDTFINSPLQKVKSMRKYKEKPEAEGAFGKPLYKEGEIEDLYELHPERKERLPVQERPLQEERIVREITTRREALPRMTDDVVKPLKLLGNEVIGSLFDRIEFLRTRIGELSEALKVRDDLHKQIVVEIDEDIRDKSSIMQKLVDIDEKRNFKLDISILRKEKRLESIQYWRDIVELRVELRELMEKEEVEKKIMEVFKDLDPAGGPT